MNMGCWNTTGSTYILDTEHWPGLALWIWANPQPIGGLLNR